MTFPATSRLRSAGTHYVVSKSAAWALTRQMALELAPYGIRVNALAQGLTETDMNRADLTNPEYRRARLERIPLGMMGEPEDQVGSGALSGFGCCGCVTGASADGGRGGGMLLGAMWPAARPSAVSSPLGDPAVHVQRGAGDVARLIRCQEPNRKRNVRRAANRPERNLSG